MQKPFTFLLLFFIISPAIICSRAQEFSNHLQRMITNRRTSQRLSLQDSLTKLSQEKTKYSPNIFISPQDGLMESDKIDKLPGQPQNDVGFDQYAGYVTVDPKAGRALFYYFVESRTNNSSHDDPLVLWLNGGPGCSSLGAGAMGELGPFRVNSDGKTLFRNEYAWNNVANVIFLESPAGVGFSYSNTTSDYNNTGDTRTANDAYTFLVNWLERFPQYKSREFYITGESYAGHYAPQLARTILDNNKNAANQTVINLKGVAIGNALVDDAMIDGPGLYDHRWTHALNSDETHRDVLKYCNFDDNDDDDRCATSTHKSKVEMGKIDIDNIYAPLCHESSAQSDSSTGTINYVDPCSGYYITDYLNAAEVQKALHVKPTPWALCWNYSWTDWESHVLPTVEYLMSNGIRVWLYSGDIDANVPVTSTRYAINSLKLPIKSSWRPWYLDDEVGGYVVGCENLTFVTVRGAGHLVPAYQPQRALTMISSFLQGVYPPSS